jgi:hypothetical protein
MCYWRAVGLLCRALFSDVTLGLYTVEELGVDIDADGEVVDAGELAHTPVGPQPLTEDAWQRFVSTCEQHEVAPDVVLVRAFGSADAVPEVLTDAHLPAMRDAFKAIVAESASAGESTGDAAPSAPPADDDGIIDADVVEPEQEPDGPVEPPAPAAPPRPTPTAGTRPATRGQVGQIKAQWSRLGIPRDEQIAESATLVGRPIASHNDLTFDEAAALLDALKRRPDPSSPAEPVDAEQGALLP